MRPSPVEVLARLRVCRDAGVRPDLGLVADSVEVIESFVSAELLRERRDRHIRRAALLVEGSAWQRAGRLSAEASRMNRVWARLRTAPPDVGTVRGELHQAALLAPLPASRKQFERLIRDADSA